MKHHLLIWISPLFLSACALLSDPVGDHYVDVANRKLPYAVPAAKPEIIYALDVKKEALQIEKRGYAMIGYSSFRAKKGVHQNDIISQAKDVNADIALIFRHNISVSKHIEEPYGEPQLKSDYNWINDEWGTPYYDQNYIKVLKDIPFLDYDIYFFRKLKR